MCVLSLEKPEHMSLDEFFYIQNFDVRSYKEYWSEHESVFEELQLKSDTNEEFVLAAFLDRLLHIMEGGYKVWTVLVNTVAHDAVWLSELLSDHGFPKLELCRNGDHHVAPVCHLRSYLCGLAGVPIYQEKHKQVRRLLSEFIPESGEYDPAAEARNILKSYQHACVQAKTKSRVRRRKRGKHSTSSSFINVF